DNGSGNLLAQVELVGVDLFLSLTQLVGQCSKQHGIGQDTPVLAGLAEHDQGVEETEQSFGQFLIVEVNRPGFSREIEDDRATGIEMIEIAMLAIDVVSVLDRGGRDRTLPDLPDLLGIDVGEGTEGRGSPEMPAQEHDPPDKRKPGQGRQSHLEAEDDWR